MPTRATALANLATLFSAKAVRRGGVVRRNRAWADEQIGRDLLVAEVQRRGYHMIRCGGQYVIICNQGMVEVVC